MEKELSELSNNQLTKNSKNTRTLMGVFIGFMFATIMIGVFDYVNNKRISPIFISTLAMIIFALIYYKKSKELKAEIKSRDKSENAD